jgi:hypothetical protein
MESNFVADMKAMEDKKKNKDALAFKELVSF